MPLMMAVNLKDVLAALTMPLMMAVNLKDVHAVDDDAIEVGNANLFMFLSWSNQALADQRLMEATVTKKRAKEEASAGLVVTEAVYGDLKAFDAHRIVIARRASQEATPSEEPETEAAASKQRRKEVRVLVGIVRHAIG
jgi:hypothetical protein